VLRLVGGFDTLAYVTERALGVVDGLAREWEWPIDFSTRDHLCMRISVSTDLQNPLSVHKLQPGTRIPLLQCGAGLACLARQADPVRSKLIEAAIKEPGDVVWDRRGLEQVLLKSSQEGFALFRRPQRFTAMVALSVPIVVNGEANAALSVRFAERALPVAKAVERYLPRLASAASRLSDDPCSDARANAVARVY
jgi:DNA-binding IclR family transcriptional regulator